MIDQAKIDALTPQEKAILKRMLRMRPHNGIVRRDRLLRRIGIVLSLLLIALTFVGDLNDWSTSLIFFTSYIAGVFLGIAESLRSSVRAWPAIEAIVDWDSLAITLEERDKSYNATR